MHRRGGVPKDVTSEVKFSVTTKGTEERGRKPGRSNGTTVHIV